MVSNCSFRSRQNFLHFISKSISRTVWPLRARDVLFLPPVAPRTPDGLKTCPWSQRFTVPSLVEICARMWICIAYIHTYTHTDFHFYRLRCQIKACRGQKIFCEGSEVSSCLFYLLCRPRAAFDVAFGRIIIK